MSDKPDDSSEKRDWSRVNALIGDNRSIASDLKPRDLSHIPAEKSDTPSPLIVPRPDLLASQGILARLKANQLERKSALQQLQVQYNGQLEVLKETVSQAVKVHKTKVSVAAEEYLRTLDSKHLELLTQIGMRNADTRWKAVSDLTDLAVAKIHEIEGKDWPQRFIDDTIGKVFELRERVANEIMKELGTEFSAG